MWDNMKQLNLYIYHLDNLRRRKKVTVEELCTGICSDRQYRRLLSGEQNISDSKIILFCDKLGISPNDFYYSFNEKDKYEYGKIAELYTFLSLRNFKDFDINLKKINKENLVNKQNERFLAFCNIKYLHLINKSMPRETLQKLSQICNYPNCIKQTAFDFVDIVSLEIVAEIEVKSNKTEALNLLTRILNSSDMIYISSESRHILPNIYGTVSILLARLLKFDESLKLSQKGIEYSRKNSDFSTLTHLYYVKSFSLSKMNKRKEAEIEAIKCIANAISRGNKQEYLTFRKLLINDLGSDPIDLINSHKSFLI